MDDVLFIGLTDPEQAQLNQVISALKAYDVLMAEIDESKNLEEIEKEEPFQRYSRHQK